MALVLGLLANVSIHGTILAIIFAWLYALKLRKLRQAGDDLPSPREVRTGSTIFLASIFFVAICVWPTKGGLPPQGPTLNKILNALSLPSRASSSRQILPGAPAVATPPADTNTAAPEAAREIPGRDRLIKVPAVLGYAFARWWILAVAFHLLVLAYLVQRRQILFAIAPACIALFLIFVYSAQWHLGLLWITILMVLWAVWDDSPVSGTRLQTAVAVALACLSALQVPWTAHAFVYDVQNPVSPDKSTAAYLRTLPPGTTIMGFGKSDGVQPYFDHNIFLNQPQTFSYLGQDGASSNVPKSPPIYPDVVVGEAYQAAQIEHFGYYEAHRFCGALYFPNQPLTPLCLVVFRHDGSESARKPPRQ